jgi:hypothetical protein
VTERITLDAADGAELIDLFEFCCDWFDHDRCRLDHSLWRFTAGATRLGELRDDLRRFADQLGSAPLTTSGDQR